MDEGIAVTISPDDPGYFDYDGVTLDYVYVLLFWDLDLS
jgi:adenosine deaminase